MGQQKGKIVEQRRESRKRGAEGEEESEDGMQVLLNKGRRVWRFLS
jgi:hypothetical protein